MDFKTYLKGHAYRAFLGAVFLIFFLIYFVFAAAPSNFPKGSDFTIEKGASISEVALMLKDSGYIKSSFAFKVLTYFSGGHQALQPGVYSAEKRDNVFRLANRATHGYVDFTPVKIVIPEGFTNKEIAERLKRSLFDFDVEKFLDLATRHEGYLFPDTYFFFPKTSPEEIVDRMRSNFDEQIKPFEDKIRDGKWSLDEIVTMASLVEKEARDYYVKRTIAGILWKRIDEGMPLQVDAAFEHFLGKTTFELTMEDLAHDSPYNTYRYKGLPPGPIANPGLDSIKATLYYEISPYWFYLSDYTGETHFATTFEEHKVNKENYLQ